MTSTHREVERKLRVPAHFDLPDLASLPGVRSVESSPTFTMVNRYFDTPDLRLFRWGMTLRRREGSADSGWHLKVPVAGEGEGVRDEIQFPLQEEFPADLRHLVSAFTREQPITPLVTLRTARTPYLLSDADGVVRAELVDDTVTVLEGERPTATFREIEVEAVADDDGRIDEGFVDAVARELLRLGATPSTMGKAASALGPRALAPAEVPGLPWPPPDAPISETVRAFLALHVRQLMLHDLRLRLDLPDAVHQMRVSARRLRSGLKAFGDLVDQQWAEHLRAELAWMAGCLGSARDTEVLLERLDEHSRQLPPEFRATARSVVDPALGSQTRNAEGEVAALLAGERYRTLLGALIDAVRQPRLTDAATAPSDQALRSIVHRAFRRLERRVDALRLDGPAPAWHRARIAAKQARYTAETAAPLLGDNVADLASQLAKVTDVLGSHQDAYVAQQALAGLAESADGPTGLALGMLFQVEVAAEMADRERFTRRWPRVRRTARKAHLT